jgi:hypothetical protein
LTDKKQELIDKYHQWRAGWEALVQQVGEERMEQPGKDGGWSFKDLAGHLGYWWGYEAGRLEAALSGVPPTSEWDRDVDLQNEQAYEINKDRSASAVLADVDVALGRVEAALNALPDGALFDVGRYPWSPGLALGPEVVAALREHMYDEHRDDIEYWRSQT